MRTVIFVLFLLFNFTSIFGQSYRQEIHCKHFFYGYPYGTPINNDLIIRDIYAMSNNDATKFADWVAYRLTLTEVDGDLTIERKWKSDPWLDKSETLEPSDYTGARSALSTDRGHQAPLASFKGSKHAAHTNYLSNITPQKSDLNQGPWVDLENNVRDIVMNCNTVYVMTGPLYEETMPQLPNTDETHVIPSGYWKIICVEETDKIRTAAFIFDQNTPRNASVIDHLVTIREVERRSDLDFLWVLDDEKEEDIETNLDTSFANIYFNN